VLRTESNISEDHPVISQLQSNINKLKRQLEQETQNYIQRGMEIDDPVAHSQDVLSQIFSFQAQMISLRTKEEQLKKMSERYDAKMEQLPEQSLQYARLQREKKVNENLYMLLKNKFEEVRITEAGQVGSVRVVDMAIPPKAPVKPNKKRNLLLGAMLGLMSGFGLSIMIDYLDSSVQGEKDINSLGLNMLAAVPIIQKQTLKNNNGPRTNNGAKQLKSRLINRFDTTGPVFESYRALRTKLQYVNPDKPKKSILITSPGPAEGKSTTAVNLAISLAEREFKTLLIDGDMRKPMLHKVLNLSKSPGLSDVLVGKIEKEAAIQSGGIEHLYILTGGQSPPNPPELLDSNRMEQMLYILSQEYDRIIIDSPPVNVVTDAVVLSTHADTTIMVAAFGETKQDALQHAVVELKEVGGNIFGVLLNKKKANRFYDTHYHYKYYYGTNGESKNWMKKIRS
jgi:capsular exopolysaccharide synthesis family protein